MKPILATIVTRRDRFLFVKVFETNGTMHVTAAHGIHVHLRLPAVSDRSAPLLGVIRSG